MPSKGKTRVTDAQRAAIATAKLKGLKREEIAAEVGLGVSTVDHQLADPRTVTHLQRLKQQSEPKIAKMWMELLKRLEKDIKATDHVVSATARAQFLRLLPLGDPPLVRLAPADNSGGDFTLEELLVSYRRVSVSGARDASAIRE